MFRRSTFCLGGSSSKFLSSSATMETQAEHFASKKSFPSARSKPCCVCVCMCVVVGVSFSHPAITKSILSAVEAQRRCLYVVLHNFRHTTCGGLFHACRFQTCQERTSSPSGLSVFFCASWARAEEKPTRYAIAAVVNRISTQILLFLVFSQICRDSPPLPIGLAPSRLRRHSQPHSIIPLNHRSLGA